MIYFRQKLHLRKGESVSINCHSPCYIYLLNEKEFNKFKKRKPFKYHAGGLYQSFPVTLSSPINGELNLVIRGGVDLSSLNHTITLIPI